MKCILAYATVPGLYASDVCCWKEVDLPNGTTIEQLLTLMPNSTGLKRCKIDRVGPRTLRIPGTNMPEADLTAGELKENYQYLLRLRIKRNLPGKIEPLQQKLLRELATLNPPGNISYDFECPRFPSIEDINE